MFKKKKQPSPPERRQANVLGRTNAYSYHARRSPEPSVLGRQLFRDAMTVNARAAKRATHYWLQRSGMLLVVVAVVISLGNVIGLSSDPKILPVDPSQTTYLRSAQTYQQAAQKLFASSILNGNKITVNTEGISTQLKRQFPELAIVSVNLPLLGRRPIVYIQSTVPIAVLATTYGKYFVVDQNGRAVSLANAAAAANLHLTPLNDASGAQIKLGDLAISNDTASFIQTIVYELGQKDLHVSMMALPAAKSELDVSIAGQPYFVKFNTQNSGGALQQVGTFLAVRHNLVGRGITPAQYIDVRVDGRAYYK